MLQVPNLKYIIIIIDTGVFIGKPKKKCYVGYFIIEFYRNIIVLKHLFVIIIMSLKYAVIWLGHAYRAVNPVHTYHCNIICLR